MDRNYINENIDLLLEDTLEDKADELEIAIAEKQIKEVKKRKKMRKQLKNLQIMNY